MPLINNAVLSGYFFTEDLHLLMPDEKTDKKKIKFCIEGDIVCLSGLSITCYVKTQLFKKLVLDDFSERIRKGLNRTELFRNHPIFLLSLELVNFSAYTLIEASYSQLRTQFIPDFIAKFGYNECFIENEGISEPTDGLNFKYPQKGGKTDFGKFLMIKVITGKRVDVIAKKRQTSTKTTIKFVPCKDPEKTAVTIICCDDSQINIDILQYFAKAGHPFLTREATEDEEKRNGGAVSVSTRTRNFEKVLCTYYLSAGAERRGSGRRRRKKEARLLDKNTPTTLHYK